MIILLMTALILALPIMGEVYEKGSDNIITRSSEDVTELVGDLNERIRDRVAKAAAARVLQQQSEVIPLRLLQLLLQLAGFVLRAIASLIKHASRD